MLTIKTTRNLSCIAITCLMLQGCNWVDSAGEDSVPGENTDGFSPVLVLPSMEAPTVISLANNESLSVIEQTPLVARLDGVGNTQQNWQWAQIENSEQRCAEIEGFDLQYAESSLADACTDPAYCTVEFDEYTEDGATHFTIKMPMLRAPVQLDYLLTAAPEDGSPITRNQTLCAVSVNEAPDANDNAFIALRNEVRISKADDPDSLLANDNDDTDVRNQALTINPTPVEPPLHASVFSLRSDGSFLYLPKDDIPANDSGYFEDRFIYAVTDGLHTVNATAVITVVDNNQGPQTNGTLDEVELVVEGSQDEATAVLHLTDHFTDPDGDRLYFSVGQQTLPPGIQATLLADGMLSLEATNDAVGIWLVRVTATDGLETTSDFILLKVDSSLGTDNQSPTASDISNKTVRGNFTYDVSEFFNDPDGDELSFSATGLPTGVSINQAGVIRGTATSSNTGSWFVTVTADDDRGASVSDSFRLSIR